MSGDGARDFEKFFMKPRRLRNRQTQTRTPRSERSGIGGYD
jgi:hypothetical protein